MLFAITLTGLASTQAATITVGSAASTPGTNYNSVQAAYDYIKSLGSISEAYTIEIQGSYTGESNYPIQLTAITGTNATNTITIKPAAGATVIIANPSSVGSATKTIVFDGASYVNIDGLARTGSTGLTIENPNTSSVHSVYFTNGATNNKISNCFIKGASTTKGSATINNAVVAFDNLSGNGNIIENNDICNSASGTPVTMVLVGSEATSAAEYQTIQNNNIYNYNYIDGVTDGVCAAVHVTGATANVRILNNKVYWSGTIAASKASIYGFTFDVLAIGAESQIEGNMIGGTDVNNSNTAIFNTTGNIMPINANLNSTIKNNTIKNIQFTTTTGPMGYMININGNGTGLADANAWTGNTVSDIDMTYSGTGTNALSGLYITATATTPARNISNNNIYNLKLKSTSNLTTIIRAIFVNTTVPTAIWSYTANKIHDLHIDETTETSTHGIIAIDTRANTGLIEKNHIYNFKTSNTGTKETVLHGIRVNGNNASGTTVKNNVISIGNGITGSSQIRGLVHSGSGTGAQVVNVFNNTIYLAGSQQNATANASASSSCFYRDGSIIANLTLKNNIFVNSRTTTQSTEILSAIFAATGISNITTSDYNILVAPVCVRINSPAASYVTLANWRTATTETKDMISSDTNPVFADANAAIPDLRVLSNTSSAYNGGEYLTDVTDDFTGRARTNVNGRTDIGAYLVGDFTGLTTNAPQTTPMYGGKRKIVFENMEAKLAQIYNMNGSLIHTCTIQSDKFEVSINSGIYFVKVGNVNSKVMVK